MRVFIGFQWKDGLGNLKTVPVKYGDGTRQIANIIRENSENKLLSVPMMSCYFDGIELDISRLSDPTFISKVNVRERRYDDTQTGVTYRNQQGGNYTVERLMPTPFTMSLKMDLWTSNTDQKFQLLEQIAVMFNPSLEIQTNDNYLDWTSLSAIILKSITPTSRSIPQGADTDIDVASMTFELPIWISPPAKVKKLGVIKNIIANVFAEDGSIKDIEDLVYNNETPTTRVFINSFPVVLLNANTGVANEFHLTIQNPKKTAEVLNIESHQGSIDWYRIIELNGGYKAGDKVYFKLDNGYNIYGTYVINPINPRILVVTLDADSLPTNTSIVSAVFPEGKTFIDAIINPVTFNPTEDPSRKAVGVRYLILESVRDSSSWKNNDNTFTAMAENSIIEWDGAKWVVVFTPGAGEVPTYVTNAKTGIQYRWTGEFWIKSFEGEYIEGSWGLLADGFVVPEPVDYLPDAISSIQVSRSLALSTVQGNAAAETQVNQAFDDILSVIQFGPSIPYNP